MRHEVLLPERILTEVADKTGRRLADLSLRRRRARPSSFHPPPSPHPRSLWSPFSSDSYTITPRALLWFRDTPDDETLRKTSASSE